MNSGKFWCQQTASAAWLVSHRLAIADFRNNYLESSMHSLACLDQATTSLGQVSMGLITPSYAGDFERCRLLCQTRQELVSDKINHYIIVDRRDLELFKQLRNANTEILAVEEILPWWLKRAPFVKKAWVSFKTLPVRNWILQQLVKLSVANIVLEDMLVFVDSDVAFLRPFDGSQFVREGKLRLYRESNSIPGDWQNFRRWYTTASRLLDVPQVTYPAPNFIGDLVTWKRSNVLKLHRHLEDRFSRPWLETLASNLHWSEYILYGMFVEHILQEQSGHYYDELYPGLQYFSTKPMSKTEIQAFLATATADHITVMISSKAEIPPQRYSQFVLDIARQTSPQP